MTLRILFPAAILLAAPAALAQTTPEAAFGRFVELANAGKLATPEGQAILTGEAKANATSAASNLPAADRIIRAGASIAAAHIVLRGSAGEEADAYFYLDKTAEGWRVSAFRAMALSGMDVVLLREMGKRPQLTPEDELRKRNLELVLSSDSKLRAWFTANHAKLESLAQSQTRQPASSAGLAAIGLSSVEAAGDGVRITIGGTLDNTVGFLLAGPSGPPPVSPSGYI